MPEPFDYSGGKTPQQIEQERRLASALASQGVSSAPVGHWTQALARPFQALTGRWLGDQAGEAERSGQAQASSALVNALTSKDPSAAIAEGIKTPFGPSMLGPVAGQAIASKMQQNTPAAQLALRMKQLELEQFPLRTDLLKAQIEQAKQKDWFGQFMRGQLGMGPEAGAAPSAASPGAATSSAVAPLPAVPGVSVATPSAAPTSAPTEDIIEVPGLGRMSRDRAMKFAFAANAAGKKDLAEMILQVADPNRAMRESAQKEAGKAQGQAQAALPAAVANTQRLVGMIDRVAADPNLGGVTGPIQGAMPTLSGKKIDLEERIKQIHGALFLKAYETLKGGGTITEVEGAKAEQSIARLKNLRQSDAGYKQALAEARKDILDLVELAKAKAEGRVPKIAETDPLSQAREAIAKGAPREQVIERLRQNGVDPAGL